MYNHDFSKSPDPRNSSCVQCGKPEDNEIHSELPLPVAPVEDEGHHIQTLLIRDESGRLIPTKVDIRCIL